MNLEQFLKPKRLNQTERAVILTLAFILFFDFILYPYPILAKESLIDNLFGDVNSPDQCLANQTPFIELYANKNETTPTAVGLEIALEQPRLPEIKAAKVKDAGYHHMTAYTSEVAQTDASPCITANGFNVCEHGIEDTVAANFLKFGTKVKIPELFGDRVFVVRDRMNRRYPDRVDVWFKDKGDALKFGVRLAKLEVVE